MCKVRDTECNRQKSDPQHRLNQAIIPRETPSAEVIFRRRQLTGLLEIMKVELEFKIDVNKNLKIFMDRLFKEDWEKCEDYAIKIFEFQHDRRQGLDASNRMEYCVLYEAFETEFRPTELNSMVWGAHIQLLNERIYLQNLLSLMGDNAGCLDGAMKQRNDSLAEIQDAEFFLNASPIWLME